MNGSNLKSEVFISILHFLKLKEEDGTFNPPWISQYRNEFNFFTSARNMNGLNLKSEVFISILHFLKLKEEDGTFNTVMRLWA